VAASPVRAIVGANFLATLFSSIGICGRAGTLDPGCPGDRDHGGRQERLTP